MAGRPASGLIALTADDAYASLLATEPILKRKGVPFSVFVVSDALITGQTFWWDRIDDAFQLTSPERWRRFEDECGLPDTYRRGQPVGEGPIRPLRQWLLARHAGVWPETLEAALRTLEDEAGGRTAQRSMTESELAGFVARTGSSVGVHTASHPVLPFLGDDQVVDEIARGHDALRARFTDVLPLLAVPFGLFDARVLRLASKAGMLASLTLAGTPVRAGLTPTLGIARICVVREYTSGVVALRLSGVAALADRLRGRPASPYPSLPSPNS
jgi:peptidoglycan/xylan/chitin deacetylase (PgdA/CDA1 family)